MLHALFHGADPHFMTGAEFHSLVAWLSSQQPSHRASANLGDTLLHVKTLDAKKRRLAKHVRDHCADLLTVADGAPAPKPTGPTAADAAAAGMARTGSAPGSSRQARPSSSARAMSASRWVGGPYDGLGNNHRPWGHSFEKGSGHPEYDLGGDVAKLLYPGYLEDGGGQARRGRTPALVADHAVALASRTVPPPRPAAPPSLRPLSASLSPTETERWCATAPREGGTSTLGSPGERPGFNASSAACFGPGSSFNSADVADAEQGRDMVNTGREEAQREYHALREAHMEHLLSELRGQAAALAGLLQQGVDIPMPEPPDGGGPAVLRVWFGGATDRHSAHAAAQHMQASMANGDSPRAAGWRWEMRPL